MSDDFDKLNQRLDALLKEPDLRAEVRQHRTGHVEIVDKKIGTKRENERSWLSRLLAVLVAPFR